MTDRTRLVPDRVGTWLDRKYHLLRLVGTGGMGCVYEAENTWTRRRVAIKFLHAEAAADPEVVRRFMREAQSPALIAHPNIVEILDVGFDEDGAPYLIQEFLDGSTLRDVLETRRLSLEEALDIALPAARALAAAHARGIVHRDVKPANIFLCVQGEKTVPKLIDFGLAKLLTPPPDDGVSRCSFGTPRYMSPEQIRAEPDLDGRTDVWSLGVVLWEMLAGRCPFRGSTAIAVMQEILATRVPRLDEVEPLVPAELAALVHRALAPERAERVASMQQLADELSACRQAWVDPDEELSSSLEGMDISRKTQGLLLPDDDSMDLPSVDDDAGFGLTSRLHDATTRDENGPLPDESGEAAAAPTGGPAGDGE